MKKNLFIAMAAGYAMALNAQEIDYMTLKKL